MISSPYRGGYQRNGALVPQADYTPQLLGSPAQGGGFDKGIEMARDLRLKMIEDKMSKDGGGSLSGDDIDFYNKFAGGGPISGGGSAIPAIRKYSQIASLVNAGGAAAAGGGAAAGGAAALGGLAAL